MRSRTGALAALAAAAVVTLSAAQDPPAARVNTDRTTVAVHGYDVVSYFTDQKPVKGSAAFSQVWRGATWRFATAEHRDLFARSPEQYAPQFGGFCAWAVSRNYTADIDPAAWTIAGGRLFLNYSLSVQRKWLEDRDGNIARGDANWPALSRSTR